MAARSDAFHSWLDEPDEEMRKLVQVHLRQSSRGCSVEAGVGSAWEPAWREPNWSVRACSPAAGSDSGVHGSEQTH